MLTTTEREAKFRAIEKLRKVRAANVRMLMESVGSWVALGRQCGQSDSFLVQIAGPNPRRSIGEVLARDLERQLKLHSGWLDVDRS